MNLWPFPSRPQLLLGTTGPWWWPQPVSVPLSQAATHLHVIGTSGAGKSFFLAGLYVDLVSHGLPATLIDPHGDLAELVFRLLVARGVYDTDAGRRRVLYLDLGAAERAARYLPFNILVQDNPAHTVAADFREAMHRAFPELAQGAATFDSLLPRAVRVLLAAGVPVTELETFLLDDGFRTRLLARAAGPDTARIAQWFVLAYDQLRKTDQLTYAGSVMRRAQLLTDLPVLAHSLSQPGNLLQWPKLFDAGISCVINLAVRDLEAKRLLGCLFTVTAEQAAKARAAVFAERRGPSHHLLIDEFQMFAAQSSEALASMLSETRKYGVYLGMSHQSFDQLAGSRVQGALANVGLRVVFKLDREDAELAAKKIGQVETKTVRQTVEPQTSESAGMAEQWERWVQDIMQLAGGRRGRPGEAFVRLPAGAVRRMRCRTVPTPQVDQGKLREVRAHFLTTYFRPEVAPAAPLALTQPAPVAAARAPATRRKRALPTGNERR